MTWIYLWAALQASWCPRGSYQQYLPSEEYELANTFEISLEGEIRFLEYRGCHVFVGGRVDVPTVGCFSAEWPEFWPISLASVFRAGARLGVLSLIYEHQCIHPVISWAEEYPVRWESYYDRLILRVETGR